MDLPEMFTKRGDTADFSKSHHELLFSFFMVVLAYFYRQNPLIDYPEVLYFFLLLLTANLAFNRIFSAGTRVSLWLVDAMLFSNIAIITAIIFKSGGCLSYFWVLYLLPIFTAALAGRLFEMLATTALCVLALGALSLKPALAETTQMFAFFIKFSVFLFSAFVTYRSARVRRRLEAEMAAKRFQVEKLLAAASERDQKTQSETSAAEVGRMKASLLHDIGSVISIILISAEIMVTEETPNPKDAQRVEKAARMAKSIIDSSLALIKGVDYEFHFGPIKDPLANAVAIFTRQAQGKGVTLSVSVEDGLPDVKISAPHIQRVFINSIANSLSYLKPGGAITTRVTRAGDDVRVSIEDDGPGFPPELLAGGITVFGTTRKEKGGTGFGLFNAKTIVERHGGRISLRNKQPSGAVVEFTLPFSGPPSG